MIKRRKVVQAHIDIVNQIIDDITNGKMNSIEAEGYINKKAEEIGIEKISKYTIENLVEEILEDTPQKLALYKEKRRHNIGKRNPEKIKDEVKKQIIEEDLPRIIGGEIEVSKVAQKYGISARATGKIIEEYLKPNEEEYKKYKQVIKKNTGASLEQRRIAKRKREDINSKNIVKNEEFLLLPIEEQRELVSIKFLQSKLKEKNIKGISDKEYVDGKVKEKVEYFLSRNIEGENQANLKEVDALYMMYRFPSMINYSIEDKIDKVINYLEKKAELGFTDTNHIIKRFPSILGYSIERTEAQINILRQNNLIDAIITHPMRLMESPELMYALIEYAKQRHKTNNLDKVNRTNIFLTNKTMKRLYHTNYDEIKERFSLKEAEKEHSANEDLKEFAIGENIQSQENILLETKRGVTGQEKVNKIKEK